MTTGIIHLRLSELNGKIKDVISNSFSSLTFWVIADITNHTFRSEKNYHHFELVEKDPNSNNIIAKISGKLWSTGSNKITNFENNSLEIREGKIIINQKKTSYYIARQNYYFAVGDNFDNSIDSRYWGFIPEKAILAKVIK